MFIFLLSFLPLCKLLLAFRFTSTCIFLQPFTQPIKQFLSLSLALSLSLFQRLNFHSSCCPTASFSISLVSNHSFLIAVFLQTEQFVHTLKDELVKSALLALHAAQPGYVSKNQKQTPVQGGQQQGHNHQSSDQNQSPTQGLPGHSPTMVAAESTVLCNNVEESQSTTRGESGPLPLKHQDSIPHHKEYDEEEWVSVNFLVGH